MQWRVKDMADITIMLVCSAGMSTSLLVSKMQKSAESKGLKAEIFANSANEADKTLRSKDVDVLLLGPQVRFMKSQFEKKVVEKNIPVDVIDMRDYGMVNGDKVLQTALDLLDNE